jgi:superoxide dismutase, Fe-Mn family
MTIATPVLPYDTDALEPRISRASLENHFNNHHKRYVERTKALVEGTPLADATLEEIIERTARRKTTSELFDNAAQAWNHAFFWRSMKRDGGGAPTGAIARQIGTDFRGHDDFTKRFKKAAKSLFGSGWVWLVLDANKLKIATTKNANSPGVRGLKPILALDLWEHAYYMDYRSRRDDFVDGFLTSLVNWDFANENLAKANVIQMVDHAVGENAPSRPSAVAV